MVKKQKTKKQKKKTPKRWDKEKTRISLLI